MKNKISRIILSVLFVLFLQGVYSQNLAEADSLFDKGNFTEAMKIYEDLFNQGQFSPAQLLKMAFISEGLSKNANALIYLDQYYELTHNVEALQQMKKIADAENLSGYNFSDEDWFLNLYYNHKISLIILLLIVLLSATLSLTLLKKKNIPVYVLIVLLTATVALLINDVFKENKAVINRNQTLAMLAANAGSELVGILNEGDKVKIVDKNEIWTCIQWSDRNVYVRTSRITPLN